MQQPFFIARIIKADCFIYARLTPHPKKNSEKQYAHLTNIYYTVYFTKDIKFGKIYEKTVNYHTML